MRAQDGKTENRSESPGISERSRQYWDSLKLARQETLRLEALNRIEEYSSNTRLDTLKEIDISNADLVEFPKFILEASNLEILVLDRNRFEKLPKEIKSLENLKRLYWRNRTNQDADFRIPRIKAVEKFDMSGNGFRKLPKVHKLKGLKELVAENNLITKIPVWKIWHMQSLEELDLSMNPVVLKKRWYGLANHLKTLKINKAEISSVHPFFYKMTGLTELQLQVNNIRELPNGISELSELQKVALYKNQLERLPDDFYSLANLDVVDLYYNKLKKVPREISKLSSLKILYLSFNEIYDLPVELGDLVQLEELYIHHNKISELPASMANLENLKVFHFQGNYLNEFPEFVLSMPSLVDLDISDNEITKLPAGLEQMNLEAFYWKELPIDLNTPQHSETRDMILRIQQRDMAINPKVYITNQK